MLSDEHFEHKLSYISSGGWPKVISPPSKKFWKSDRTGLQRLFDELLHRGYELQGPRICADAVRLARLEKTEDLPEGWEDEQDSGKYQLQKTGRKTLFGVVHGPASAKPHFFPPVIGLWRARKTGATVTLIPEPLPTQKTALVGIRPCDLHAVEIQDKVFMNPVYPDPDYSARRKNTLIVVAQCTRCQPTCFCTFMGGDTRATSGFDIALTEIEGEPVRYLFEAGSDIGAEVLSKCKLEQADTPEVEEADGLCSAAAETQLRGIDTEDIQEALYQNHDHPEWQRVAKRCFACTSCTQVCPTCFCHTPRDESSLDAISSQRTRVWDSCFEEDFSYIHGGSVRRSLASRYRQWLTHKLASWQEQFGTLGCVGCGRCITWCPARIDLRDEVETIRQHDLVTQSK